MDTTIGASADMYALLDYKDWGLLREQRSREFSNRLTIWNYTPKCQRRRHWDAVTMQCRGLITDNDMRIVARPFRKFFNLEEWEAMGQPVPNEPFSLQAKIDGSLIIVASYQGEMVVASRGSFDSEQGRTAREILASAYPRWKPREGVTYCFEIVYPKNRLVIDYGDINTLVLLAMIETGTGREMPLYDTRFPIPAREWRQPGEYRDLPQKDNSEGYVLQFQGGLRLRVKNKDYLRLHRLYSTTSPRTIWEAMRDSVQLSAFIEQGAEEFCEHAPQEFYDWARQTCRGLRAQYWLLACRVDYAWGSLSVGCVSRKELAREIRKFDREIQAMLFMRLDGKDYSDLIWKAIKPDTRPYIFRQAEFEGV